MLLETYSNFLPLSNNPPPSPLMTPCAKSRHPWAYKMHHSADIVCVCVMDLYRRLWRIDHIWLSRVIAYSPCINVVCQAVNIQYTIGMNRLWVKYFNFYMEQISYSKDESRSARQEIPCLLGGPNAHYHVQNTQKCITILSQLNLIDILTSCSLNNHFNSILPSINNLPRGLSPSGFPTQMFCDRFTYFMPKTNKPSVQSTQQPDRTIIVHASPNTIMVITSTRMRLVVK
jgi:hypothetical protein